MRVPLLVFGLALVAFLCACSRTLHLELSNGIPVKLITSYEDSETGIVRSREVLLQPDTSEYRLLQQWLTRNQHGWSQSIATNPNGGIIVHAGDLSLQFVDDAVFTWSDKGQFQKRIPEEDYAFLKKPAGT